MDDETPLDLRALAEVESSDAVREALARFRRRALTGYLWVVAAGVLFVAAVLWGRTPTLLSDRVDHAEDAVYVEKVWRADGVTIALDKIADLGDTKGLRFFVIPEPGSRAHLRFEDVLLEQGSDAWAHYVELALDPGEYPTMQIATPGGSRREIALGGAGSGIPDGAWR